ncbi:lanthionine synthetase LanC family protein [Intrasporangium sp. YIM S08009]|uniref:lanthionine synthetase LanC family protein n=1 Tax=Intrasporangium zincisolvens TaxID=3080018 RepID=UPI002B056A17|nr:lanthionine synthetase LanC family protein [Intrasporangium sp. YIM S08009]
MEVTRPDDRAAAAEGVGLAAADWLLEGITHARERRAGSDWDDPSLYHGRAGLILALREAAAHTGEHRYTDAVEAGADALADLEAVAGSSLYFGLAGVAVALHAVGRDDDARAALRRVRSRSRDGRWGEMFELFAGNAGIGLAALRVGDLDLAVDAVAPYVAAATPTPHGVNWAVRPTPPRSHHVAHGTLGIVLALASVGTAADRPDLLDLALRGASDVVSRDEQGPSGFLVPHSDPPHRPDIVERYSLGWCNGPAGDAQVFRLLHQVTGDTSWLRLADRCWHTVTSSGLPARLRPGFWDNHGRCCGTAGVLALALDREVELGEGPAFTDVLVDDLLARATIDASGARWSNHEHRSTPAELDPRPGWAMGNAGILRELLRYARLRTGRPDAYAAPWPDHPPTRRPRQHTV